MVEQALGDVECGGSGPLARGEYDLVHHGTVVGELEERAEFREQVIGVEHGVAADVQHALAAEERDVGERSDKHAEVALRRAASPDALRGHLAAV